jgi:hypothetical protein
VLDTKPKPLSSVRNNFFDWQLLQPNSNGGIFYDFCDALEVQNGVSANASGWGLRQAYTSWGQFWNETYYAVCECCLSPVLPLTDTFTDFCVPENPACGSDTPEDCLGTFNASSTYYTDIGINNPVRSWKWFVCNYVGWFEDGYPANTTGIVSPLITSDYEEVRPLSLFYLSRRHPPK